MNTNDLREAMLAMSSKGLDVTHLCVGPDSAEAMNLPGPGAYEKQDGLWVRVSEDTFDVIPQYKEPTDE